MKFSASVIVALSTSVSGGYLFGSVDQSVAGNELDVPGQSPLQYCAKPTGEEVVTIEKVDLDPNPPEAGSNLTIKASGHVSETIEDGAYVNLIVKYGYIRLINTRADFCEQVKNVELECPIKEGNIAVAKSVELPREIPKGRYTVHADVYTKDDKHITCLQASVEFPKNGGSLFPIDL